MSGGGGGGDRFGWGGGEAGIGWGGVSGLRRPRWGKQPPSTSGGLLVIPDLFNLCCHFGRSFNQGYVSKRKTT